MTDRPADTPPAPAAAERPQTPEAVLAALVPPTPDERKRAFSALLRAVLDDGTGGGAA